MKIKSKFRVTSSTQQGAGNEIGVFADLLEDSDCTAFSNANLENEDKHVAVFVYEDGAPEDQAPEMFLCSKRLSKVVRKSLRSYEQEDVLSALLTLKVFENDRGRFIAVKGVKRDKVTKKDLMARATKPSYEDLALGKK